MKINLHTYKNYKNSFYALLIISAIFIVLGIILIRSSIIGVLIIFIGLITIISSYEELQKFYRFEKEVKHSFKVHKLADFGNFLYEYRYKHLQEERKNKK